MNAWWELSVVPALYKASRSINKADWYEAVQLLNRYASQIDSCWSDIIQGTKDCKVTKAWLDRYRRTILSVEEAVDVLNANGWSFEWYKRPNLRV